MKCNEQRAQAQPGRRLGAGPLSHLASASRSLTASTHVSPNSGNCSRLAASARCAATARGAVHRRIYACTAAPRSSSGTRRVFARASRRTKATRAGATGHRPRGRGQAGGSARSGGAQGKCGGACGVESGVSCPFLPSSSPAICDLAFPGSI